MLHRTTNAAVSECLASRRGSCRFGLKMPVIAVFGLADLTRPPVLIGASVAPLSLLRLHHLRTKADPVLSVLAMLGRLMQMVIGLCRSRERKTRNGSFF